MEENIKCESCNEEIDIKQTKVYFSKGIINEKEYTITYFICPNCDKSKIVFIDNEITSGVAKELESNNLMLQKRRNMKFKISDKMKEYNLKLRLKLNLLRSSLYKSLQGQSYQFTDINDKQITGTL